MHYFSLGPSTSSVEVGERYTSSPPSVSPTEAANGTPSNLVDFGPWCSPSTHESSDPLVTPSSSYTGSFADEILSQYSVLPSEASRPWMPFDVNKPADTAAFAPQPCCDEPAEGPWDSGSSALDVGLYTPVDTAYTQVRNEAQSRQMPTSSTLPLREAGGERFKIRHSTYTLLANAQSRRRSRRTASSPARTERSDTDQTNALVTAYPPTIILRSESNISTQVRGFPPQLRRQLPSDQIHPRTVPAAASASEEEQTEEREETKTPI